MISARYIVRNFCLPLHLRCSFQKETSSLQLRSFSTSDNKKPASGDQIPSATTTRPRRQRHEPSAEDIAAFEAKLRGSKPPKKRSKLGHAIKEFGIPFMIYWTGVWAASGVSIFAALEFSGVALNTSEILQSLGYDGEVNKDVGNIVLAVGLNEAAEVIRLPLCLLTFKRARQWYRSFKIARNVRTNTSRNRKQ